MVEDLQEPPRSVTILAEARRRVNEMFERYRRENVDNWEPDECPSRKEFP
jgi:hypothetical protein